MNNDESPPKQNLLYKFDGLVKKFIPNFNARAILYFSFVFAIALYLQVWRIGTHTPKEPIQNQETVIADDNYWNSDEYKNKIATQTVESFTSELQTWLKGQSQEFSRRKFEDILFINNALSNEIGETPATVIPENFNYLENHARARYQYADANKFLNESPALISHGNIVCDLDERTEKATSIELYEWRYASMNKLAEFMNTKPDWKIKLGDRILDVSDPRIEDPALLSLKTPQNQPPGLFSFLLFKDTKSNHIFLADSTILENNQIDSRLTLSSLTSSPKTPKLYFKYGYEGCRQINNPGEVHYDQFD